MQFQIQKNPAKIFYAICHTYMTSILLGLSTRNYNYLAHIFAFLFPVLSLKNHVLIWKSLYQIKSSFHIWLYFVVYLSPVFIFILQIKTYFFWEDNPTLMQEVEKYGRNNCMIRRHSEQIPTDLYLKCSIIRYSLHQGNTSKLNRADGRILEQLMKP